MRIKGLILINLSILHKLPIDLFCAAEIQSDHFVSGGEAKLFCKWMQVEVVV
jgi:hypothetical protein